jgi:hypothetical protein
VEFCDNLIFRRRAALDRLGERLLDANRTIGQPTFLDISPTGHLQAHIFNTPAAGDWLQIDFFKTNGVQVTVGLTNASTNVTTAQFVQSLMNQVNANAALQSADGVVAADLIDGGTNAQLTLYARSPGWAAAEIQAAFTASTNLLVQPAGTNKLEQNLNDLHPRNHLYVSSGVTTLPVSFALDTTKLPDGCHELAAVAYEGTSVRTQTRVTRMVRIQNTSLTATLSANLAGTNATLDFPLHVTVTAGVTNIAAIQLFSTGGLLGSVSNQTDATFSVSSASLGAGLHPIYALVTDTLGHQYRTETLWIRLVPSITLSLAGPPFVLSWLATPGLSYDVLATTNLAAAFQPVASVFASTSAAQWPVSLPAAGPAFFRVQLQP